MTIRIHAEPVKAGLTRLLAVFGNELIYETPGDTKRGNPLDIIVVATCYDCEDVTRETAYVAKETAKRLARLWNAAIHPDDPVAELAAVLEVIGRRDCFCEDFQCEPCMARAALAKYKATTTKENEHGQAIP